MPKLEHKIVGFHGGINDNSDPKDIQDIDLVEADGVSVNKIGKLINVGVKGSGLSSLDNASIDIEPGYGLHYFSTDYDSSSANNPEDYLAIYDKATTRVKFYYRDKNGSSPGFLSNEVIFGSAIKPNYYYAEGMLRISDANHSEDSKWFGYIDSTLYWTNPFGNTNNVHDIKKFSSGDQKFRTLNELATVKALDISDVNPTEAQIGNLAGKVTLGYIKNEGGNWTGNYVFGASIVYKGNQEGPVDSIYENYVNRVEQTVALYENRMSFQVYISMGESNTISSSANHIIGSENRMIGINWYFKEQGDEEWTFLRHTDLREGGKHYWKVFDATNNGNHGIWSGTTTTIDGHITRENGISIWSDESTPGSAIHFSDKDDGTGIDWMNSGTSYSSSTEGKSYAQVYLRVKLKNNNSTSGFDNRYGFLRVWGGATSPLYVSSVNDSLIPLKTGTSPNHDTDSVYYIPFTLPGPGTDREFRVQVLDENFNVIADGGIKTMTIADSGAVAPDEYEQEVEIG